LNSIILQILQDFLALYPRESSNLFSLWPDLKRKIGELGNQLPKTSSGTQFVDIINTNEALAPQVSLGMYDPV
jgi:hypothetical protein